MKILLRQGIPISQRGTVWKAIVDHKLMRVQNDKFEADYYKKLLANYNPNQSTLTPAAKQVIKIKRLKYFYLLKYNFSDFH